MSRIMLGRDNASVTPLYAYTRRKSLVGLTAVEGQRDNRTKGGGDRNVALPCCDG